MKILIVKLSAIGDVIHTLPALNALRTHYPTARIDWLVEEPAADLVRGHRALDRVLVSRRRHWLSGLRGAHRRRLIREVAAFITELRSTHYDMILDFQALLKSAVLIALARGDRKIGFDRGLEHMEHSYLFLNERIRPVSMEQHALVRGLHLLEAIGVPAAEVVYDLPVSDAHRRRAEDLLRERRLQDCRGLIAINPVAQWATKLWPPEKFSQLADALVRRGNARVLFTGGPGDRPVIEQILAGMACPAAHMAGETTLNVLAAVYERATCVVSTDTGPMHLAAAVGVPVVALFGPTAPWRTGPFGSGHRVLRAGVDCSPCFKRRCPTIHCMAQISVDPVLDAVQTLSGLKEG